MTLEGWEYVPFVEQDPQFYTSEADDANDRAERGYGLVDNQMPSESPSVNPNKKIRDNLPPEEPTEYLEDLLGQASPSTEDEVATSPDSQPVGVGGCTGEAQKIAFADVPYYFDTEVSAALGQVFNDIDNDPRTQEAVALWAECMKQLGHGYQSPSGIIRMLQERLRDGENASEVRQLEIDLAEADYSCHEDEVEQILQATQADHEAEFVEQYLSD